jgi:hypothetical protein
MVQDGCVRSREEVLVKVLVVGNVGSGVALVNKVKDRNWPAGMRWEWVLSNAHAVPMCHFKLHKSIWVKSRVINLLIIEERSVFNLRLKYATAILES